MLDTVPQRTEDMVRTILLTCPNRDDMMTSQELARKSRYPIATVGRIIQDLHILDVVRRPHQSLIRGGAGFTLSDYIRDCIARADLYKTEEDVSRPTRLHVRVIRRRKRQ